MYFHIRYITINMNNCSGSCLCTNANVNSVVLNKYNNQISNMIKRIPDSKYLLEITKCCKYSEFLAINKDKSLASLYKAVSVQFHQKVVSIYVYNINDPNDRLVIPFDACTTIRHFISKNSVYFKPLYPLPAEVVYKICYDDGHCHDDGVVNSDDVNMIISNSSSNSSSGDVG